MKIFIEVAILAVIFAGACYAVYKPLKNQVDKLLAELEAMKKEGRTIDLLDCLLESPTTIQEVRENSNQLFVLLHRIKADEPLKIELRKLIEIKLAENGQLMKEICDAWEAKKEEK